MKVINKVIIAGGRDYKFTAKDKFALLGLWHLYKFQEVVHGDQTGADTEGKEWGKDMELIVTAFPANWTEYGPFAGPIRNKQMAEYADAVVLFPGGKGTQSMHNEARKAGIRIFDWRD